MKHSVTETVRIEHATAARVRRVLRWGVLASAGAVLLTFATAWLLATLQLCSGFESARCFRSTEEEVAFWNSHAPATYSRSGVPAMFDRLSFLGLNITCLYGIDRVEGESMHEWAQIYSSGWPFLALTGEVWIKERRTSANTLKEEVSTSGVWRIGEDSAWLPYRPFWQPFLGNLLFYGASLYCVGIVLRGVDRRRIRIRQRRGQCVSCGYELTKFHSSVCPECGWPRRE